MSVTTDMHAEEIFDSLVASVHLRRRGQSFPSHLRQST